MKEKFLLCFLAAAFVSTAFGQGDSDAALQRSADAMKSRDSEPSYRSSYSRSKIWAPVLSKELKAKLQITEDDKAEVKNSLKYSKMRLFKLWNNLCLDSRVIDINIEEDCLKTSQYVVGSSYSFGLKNYRPDHAGISLTRGDFTVRNRYSSAQIMTDLGTTNLENLNEKSIEVLNILRFKMLDKSGNPLWRDEPEIIDFNELKLAHKLKAHPNHTYLLRSLFLDKSNLVSAYRESVIAFQLVKIENNTATILWKPIFSKWV